jgi:hypothetical protein
VGLTTQAQATWAQAKAAWSVGMEAAQAALDAGNGWLSFALPGEEQRQNNLAALRAWGPYFDATEAAGGMGAEMDYTNWEALKRQIALALLNVDAVAEGNDYQARIDAMFYTDVANAAKEVAGGALSVAVAVALVAVAYIVFSAQKAVT